MMTTRKPQRPKTLDELIGQEVYFYGVDGNRFRIGLTARAGVVFEAIEDPDDGYRSCLRSVESVEPKTTDVFSTRSFAKVVVEKAPEMRRYTRFDGYQLREGSHVWLMLGTDNSDDYYPSFTFDYTPRLAGGDRG
jgi:hypothetical protein